MFEDKDKDFEDFPLALWDKNTGLPNEKIQNNAVNYILLKMEKL